MTKQELKTRIENMIEEPVRMKVLKRGSMKGYVMFEPKSNIHFEWDKVRSIESFLNPADTASIQMINIYMGLTWCLNN